MLNGTVEPLLTMNSNSSTNRLMSIMMTNGESNSNNEILSKRSTMKITSSPDMISSPNSNKDSSINTDNRIKFIDMLVCGSCQQDFQLSDILKFIEHKGKCGNKENKHKIPYHFPQRRHRRKGDRADDDDDDDEEHQQSGNSSESDNENNPRERLSHKQTTSAKVLVDSSANTVPRTGTSHISFTSIFIYDYLYILGEPYNFECSQCGDVYSTGKRNELDIG